MKYVDEYRIPDLALKLAEKIRSAATRKWVLMEVCGGQTHGLLRHGIPQALHGSVDLIHGPGCPVCVTSERAIDFAQELALRPGVILTSFADMLRVPGSTESLLGVRSRGGNVRSVYSPVDAVNIARQNPGQQVVFFAVGFETTAPATALALLQAQAAGLRNFSILVSHVCVLPAMESIMQDPHNRVQAFLAAGHVCTVTGFHRYESFADRHRVPVAVTGFEPLDLLQGILECVSQLESGRHETVNCYQRAVTAGGNTSAQEIVNRVYEVTDQEWRGLGRIRHGGLGLRSEFSSYDAWTRFGKNSATAQDKDEPCRERDCRCRAAEVLAGKLRPNECEEFGTACTPESPLGAPMVSGEGACAAWYRYQPVKLPATS